jgi:2Fe-2S ferredoxin
MSEINIHVQNADGSVTDLKGPTDMGLSLMELLKASEYDILATCGGMALCATCHVEVIKGFDSLPEITNDEYVMLDTLPNITDTSRLSCQLKLSPEMEGITVKVMGDGLA